MKLITKIISAIFKKPKLLNEFVFPYSNNPEQKKQQIWKNLESGLLIENTQTLLLWKTPYNFLKGFNRKEKTEDRTTWHFLKCNILDGFELQFEAVKWKYGLGRDKFDYVYSIINAEITESLIKHLKKNIGLPKKENLNLDSKEYYEGECIWIQNKIKIKISTAEFHGGYAYKLKIGTEEAVDEYI